MSIASEYDEIADVEFAMEDALQIRRHRDAMIRTGAMPVLVHTVNGKPSLGDKGAFWAAKLMREGRDTLAIAELFNVPESAVYNAVYYYRRHEKELME